MSLPLVAPHQCCWFLLPITTPQALLSPLGAAQTPAEGNTALLEHILPHRQQKPLQTPYQIPLLPLQLFLGEKDWSSVPLCSLQAAERIQQVRGCSGTGCVLGLGQRRGPGHTWQPRSARLCVAAGQAALRAAKSASAQNEP